jgi:hypothetical protein
MKHRVKKKKRSRLVRAQKHLTAAIHAIGGSIRHRQSIFRKMARKAESALKDYSKE